VRIGFGIEIIAPFERGVLGGEHGKLVAIKDSVAMGLRAIAAGDQLALGLLQASECRPESWVGHRLRSNHAQAA
jgi:hypothetical protein